MFISCWLSKCDNVENITVGNSFGSDNAMKNVKTSVTNSVETVIVNLPQMTSRMMKSNDSTKNMLPPQCCRSVTTCQVDKYDLDSRFRPRHQSKIASAIDCATFKKWDDQNCEKFGFIPLGDILLPPVDLNNLTKEKFFDVHRRVKASGTHNFMQSQILIQSQLKPYIWNGT